MKGQGFRRRLGFAIAGVRTVWRSEASFRTQVRIGLGTATTLAIVRPGAAWTAIIVLAIGLVLACEAANAALEHLADTVHPALAPGVKAAKDAAAGAVLIASASALIVAVLLAAQRLLAR